MPLFVVEHTHAPTACPAQNPQMAPALLQIVSKGNAAKAGLTIYGDAVSNGGHHLYLILDGPNAESVRTYFAPFGQLGTLQVAPASHCEQVVARGSC
ncbi:MAG TPA: DUF3303 family protein [Thermoplasmata archaeon]|nr:DUF3303 family protein [Thermoplasmata archaeon]